MTGGRSPNTLQKNTKLSQRMYFFYTCGVTGIQLESGAREETGRFRDVKRCVTTGDRTGSQELASCAITARPPQRDTAGSRHRAFDVLEGSCYTILLPSAWHPTRVSKPSSATSVTTRRLATPLGRFNSCSSIQKNRPSSKHE